MLMTITAATMASAVLAADLAIEDILSENAIVAVTASDLGRMADVATENGFLDLLREFAGDEALSDAYTNPICEAWTEILAEAGVDGDLTCPSGSAGLGIYPVVDFESERLGIGVLGIVEMPDDPWASVIETAIEMGDENDYWSSQTVEIGGHDAWMVEGVGFADAAGDLPMGLADRLGDRVYVVHEDGWLLVGSEPDGIARALAALDGDPEPDALGDSGDYRAIMARVGDGGDAHAVVMMENLADTIVQMEGGGMAGMMLMMAKGVIGDVDGAGQQLTLGEDDVLVDVTYTVWMRDGRSGLLGLVEEAAPRGDVPAFIGPETVAYMDFSIDWAGLGPWFTQMTTDIPMLSMQMGGQAGVEQVAATIEAATSVLGSRTIIVNTVSRPIVVDSVGQLFAVECLDDAAFEEFLTSISPNLGSEPQDFLGSRIYTMELPGADMMGPGVEASMSVAVGGGWAIAGTTELVQDALRVLANPGEGSDDHGADAGADLLTYRAVSGWGYADILDQVSASIEVQKMQLSKMLSEMEEFDPEMAAEMREEFGGDEDGFPMEAVREFMGLMAWEMEADEEGFTSRAFLLRR